MSLLAIKTREIIEFFLPNKCLLCETFQSKNVCEACLKNLKITPKIKSATQLARNGLGNGGNITQIITLMPYSPPMQKLLAQVKFYGWEKLADQLSDHIGQEMTSLPWKADQWVSVPIHWTRTLKRGANHVELLFKKYLKKQKISRRKIIKRVKLTPPLFSYDKAARETILQNAFELSSSADIDGKTVVILDDILTTTATINEMARTLKDQGAKKIYALCLCDSERAS